MLLLVAVSVFVACSINVNRTLVQTIEKPYIRSKPFPLHTCPEIYLRGKIRWHFGHI